MSERRVSIGGSRAQIGEALEELQKQFDAGDEPRLQVRGNGGPDLELEFVDEGDELADHLLVDYYE